MSSFTETQRSDYSLSMRILVIISLVLMSLVSSPSLGLTMDDLVRREGVYYQKFSDVPFTGEIDTGLNRGSFKDGRQNGTWVHHWSDGHLAEEGNYTNGKKEGTWLLFYPHGQLWMKANYKNDIKEGAFFTYYEDGKSFTKGNYKNGRKEGFNLTYNEDGTVKKEITGTYENGLKVSD